MSIVDAFPQVMESAAQALPQVFEQPEVLANALFALNFLTSGLSIE
jgi:hypothetical protein